MLIYCTSEVHIKSFKLGEAFVNTSNQNLNFSSSCFVLVFFFMMSMLFKYQVLKYVLSIILMSFFVKYFMLVCCTSAHNMFQTWCGIVEHFRPKFNFIIFFIIIDLVFVVSQLSLKSISCTCGGVPCTMLPNMAMHC